MMRAFTLFLAGAVVLAAILLTSLVASLFGRIMAALATVPS